MHMLHRCIDKSVKVNIYQSTKQDLPKQFMFKRWCTTNHLVHLAVWYDFKGNNCTIKDVLMCINIVWKD